MTARLNNKERIAFRIVFIIFCSTLCAICYLLYPDKANSVGPYLNSAHGNTSDGVLRTSLNTPPNNYSRGNCAHCHEQHASIGGTEPAPNSPAGPDLYLLFKDLWIIPPQSNEFCFGCHMGGTGNCNAGTASCQSDWKRTNYSYSYWKGGDSSLTCPSSIYEAFQFVSNSGSSQSNCVSYIPSNVGSSHMLRNIRAFLVNKWGFSSTGANVDPCSGCHNPHKAKRDFPCSRPSAHTNKYAWDVWGDDSSEKMNVYSPNYWAPKRIGGGYEPDGSLTQDGSNLADYVTLCTDCHNSTNTIYSNRLGRNLYKISWAAGGDFHGGRQRIDGDGDASPSAEFGDLLDPYKVGGTYSRTNYILSCTDCHEPHGSPNEFLMRKSLNGISVGIISGNGLWYNWCQTCHSTSGHLPPLDSSTNCFQAGACHRHCDYPACANTRLF